MPSTPTPARFSVSCVTAVDRLRSLGCGGSGAFGLDKKTLYFTAGINDEADGLLGDIVPND
jgi:hypothetical protein